jgi:hypothetical protein
MRLTQVQGQHCGFRNESAVRQIISGSAAIFSTVGSSSSAANNRIRLSTRSAAFWSVGSNGDAREKLGLRQCYVEGEFHILMHVRLAGEDYVALFERRRIVGRQVEATEHGKFDRPLPDVNERGGAGRDVCRQCPICG